MLKSFVIGWWMSLAVIAAFAQSPGMLSGEVSASDRRAVRAVVEGQLKALAGDNAERAFSYATPAIRRQFHDAAEFVEMVRRSYPMVVRPASTSFMSPHAGRGAILQGVQFRDQEGNRWRALYELERQPDKSWRINGCAVAPDDDEDDSSLSTT